MHFNGPLPPPPPPLIVDELEFNLHAITLHLKIPMYYSSALHNIFLLPLGCILHGPVPVCCSGDSFGAWCHSTWSSRWDWILPETRLVQTGRSAGWLLFVLTSFDFCLAAYWTHWIWHPTLPYKTMLPLCVRCGLTLVPRFFSLMPSDWVPWLPWAATTASTTTATSKFQHCVKKVFHRLWK